MASFDGNSKLGFMRFIQIYNAISVLLSLVALVFVSGRELHGAVESYIAFDMALNIVCMSEIVWLISRRKQHTRAIAIVMYAAIMVSSFVMLAITGAVNPYSVVSNAIASGWPILYFATSRRAKAVLVQPFDMRLRSKNLPRAALQRGTHALPIFGCACLSTSSFSALWGIGWRWVFRFLW